MAWLPCFFDGGEKELLRGNFSFELPIWALGRIGDGVEEIARDFLLAG